MKNFKSQNNSISLKTHLWLYFCSFAVVIMLILWVLQIFFMSAFFKNMKLSELKKIGIQVKTQYSHNTDNFDNYWLKYSVKSGVFAHVIDEDGEVVHNSDILPEFKDENNRYRRNPDEPRRFVDRKYLETFLNHMSNSNSDDVSYFEKNKTIDASLAVYGAYLGERNGKKLYLFMSSPLERTDTTRRVLQTQLMIGSAVSVFLALVLAYFIAKRVSKPIENTTKSAHKLAKGEYDVNFEHGTYKEINELADVLNYTAVELSKTENLRRDLLANVSHDLKTPLTIIKSYAEMIRDLSGANEEKRNKHTEVIIEETNRLSYLVNDMLDLSRMQSGTVKMNFEPFDLAETTEYITDSLNYYREHEGYVFNTSISSHSIVMGDKRKIEQVIYNLIANAINYTGDDKSIYISVCEMKSKVRFSVRDTGKGISEDELNRVWDKYYKSSSTHTRQAIGTGIGLSIVKTILDAHNSNFGVISEVGNGSEFWFELEKFTV